MNAGRVIETFDGYLNMTKPSGTGSSLRLAPGETMLLREAIVLQILVASVVVTARVYQIPEGWICVNNSSLQQFPGYGTSGSYRLVSAFSANESSKQQPIVSDNGTFGLAFLNFNGTGNYYLSVVMGTQFYKNSSLAALVWTANRNRPVSENAMLRLSQGQLILLDVNTSAAAAAFSVQDVSSISLDEDGNFRLLNSSGDVVWQSFDHPTDVLLPGQRLVTGQKLIGSANARAISEGIYTAVAEASGIVLYLTPQNEPYFLWSLGGPFISSALRVCSGFQTVLSFTVTGGVSMRYEPTKENSEAKACSNSLNVQLSSQGSLAYLQLGYDGNLNSYKLDESGSWQVEFQLTQYLGGQCKLPLACGSYGICKSGIQKQCQCLDQGVSNRTSDSAAYCSQPAWASLENCSSRYATDFVMLSGGSYFPNQYNSADQVSSLKDCREACRSKCSCAAFFYDAATRNCYFVKDVVGSLIVDQSQTQSAFLKFQDYSKLIPLKGQKSDTRYIAGAVSGVGAAAIILTCGLLFLCYYTRKQALVDEEINKLLTTMEGPPHRFTYRRLATATAGFSKLLGTGGFGEVYEGVFRDGRKVAVKRLHSRNQGQRQFISEVASLGNISHINIVRLRGFCADSSRRLLVYEYMSNGSLDKWIFRDSSSPLSWSLRFNIAVGTARGIAYLHEECREPIIHLDIKPQNILLDDNFVAKVGDFGMAKLLMNRDISQVITGVRGTPGYLAPEWLLQSTATKKCDVYSYGMVLLELVGGRRNLEPAKDDNNLSWYFPAWAVNEVRNGTLLNVVDARIRDQSDRVEAERMVKVALWCIQENQAARPTMDAVVRMLAGQLEIPEPPLAFTFAVEATGILSITASSEHTALGYTEAD